MSGWRHAATLALLVLAIGQTWPLATAPTYWSRVDDGDYSLNALIPARVVHQAPRSPLHLFDANVCYPEPRTLDQRIAGTSRCGYIGCCRDHDLP